MNIEAKTLNEIETAFRFNDAVIRSPRGAQDRRHHAFAAHQGKSEESRPVARADSERSPVHRAG
jgi:ribosomal protein S6